MEAAPPPGLLVEAPPGTAGCRLAIFDFDGTLADTFPWFTSALDEVAETFRFEPVSPGDLEALRHRDARVVLAYLGVPAWKRPAIARFLRKRAAEAGPHPLFTGVPDMLRHLSQAGIALGIASTNGEGTIRRSLGEASALIRHWACGGSLFGKAALLRRVLRADRALPRDAILVGDELRDAEAARRAGIRFAAVAWGYTRASALAEARPDAMFERVADVAPALVSAVGLMPS